MNSVRAFWVLCILLWPIGHLGAQGLAVGKPLPFFTLKALNAEPGESPYVSLDKMIKGKNQQPRKLVLISFFASYCEPCKKELPYLAKLYELYEKDGFAAVVVTIDKEAEKIQEAKDLAQKNNVKFPVLSDRFNIVAKRYKIAELPSLFLMDNEGKALMVESGYTTNISKTLLTKIRQALGKPTADAIPAELSAFFPSEAKRDSGAAASQVGQEKKRSGGDKRKSSSTGTSD